MTDIIKQEGEIKIEEDKGSREFDRMQKFLYDNFKKEMRLIKDRFETAQINKNNDNDMWSNQGVFWDIRDNLKKIYDAYLLNVNIDNCESNNDKNILENFRKYLKSFHLDSINLVGNLARTNSFRNMKKINLYLKKYENYINLGEVNSDLFKNSLYDPTAAEKEQKKIGERIIKYLVKWTGK